jgi:hypothetical protein
MKDSLVRTVGSLGVAVLFVGMVGCGSGSGNGDGWTIQFESSSQLVAEDTGRVVIAIVSSEPNETDVQVHYELSGTAVEGEDYTVVSGSESPVTFPAGETQLDLQFDIVDDGQIENTEAFVVTLTQASPSEVGTPAEHMVTIAGAHPLSDLLPGEWYEVPGPNLDSVDPCPARDCPYSAVEGVSAVMDDWSGGAYDTRRNRLIVWGGGHGGYAGNEVYAFDVNILHWHRLTDPSSMSGFDEGAETMPDGRPKSVHTYEGLEYVPDPVDALFATMGSVYQSGNLTRTTWYFHFDTLEWTRLPDAPGDQYDDFIGYEITTAWDPATEKVLCFGAYRSADFDTTGDTWNLHAQLWQSQGLGRTGAFDTNRRLYVAVGRGAAHVLPVDGNGVMDVWQELNATGGTDVPDANAPGFVYDPVRDRFTAWIGGSDIFTLDMDALAWTLHTAANAVDPGAPNQNGTFGRFRYVPTWDVFILVNRVDENVFFYRAVD